MTDENDKNTNEDNQPGKETDPVVEKPVEDSGISPLDRAEAANKEKAELLEREEKLQERKEKLYAEEKVGGRAMAGREPIKKDETPEELAERFQKGEVDILA